MSWHLDDVTLWRKGTPGGGNSQCKGPGAGTNLPLERRPVQLEHGELCGEGLVDKGVRRAGARACWVSLGKEFGRL